MSTVSVVATVELNNVPPRVRLDVTDTGAPSITQANVVRVQSDGRTVNVRTPDGNPLTLTTSGSDRVGTVYDYEVPFGLPVRYSTLETPASQTTDVTVTSSLPWLIHPGVPSLSQPILIAGVSERSRSVERGVFRPLGRSAAVVVTDGRRKAAEYTLTVHTTDDLQHAALEAMLEDCGTLLLNVPSGKAWGISSEYIAVGDITETRPGRVLAEPWRTWTLPCTVVDTPAGGSQAQRTYADVVAESATYAALLANTTRFPTYAAVLAPVS